jgi:hypothetical protein
MLKKISTIIALLFCFSTAQDYDESRLLFREIMAAGAERVHLFEAYDWEVVKVDIDLVGIVVEKSTLKVMSSDYTYIITATGQPSRIKDLDIKVYFLPATAGSNADPYLVQQDVAVDNTPSLTFKPYATGTYMITISAAAMMQGQENANGYYFLTIGHD